MVNLTSGLKMEMIQIKQGGDIFQVIIQSMNLPADGNRSIRFFFIFIV